MKGLFKYTLVYHICKKKKKRVCKKKKKEVCSASGQDTQQNK